MPIRTLARVGDIPGRCMQSYPARLPPTIQKMEDLTTTNKIITRLKELANFLDQTIGEDEWALTGSCALNLWNYYHGGSNQGVRPANDIDVVISKKRFVAAVLALHKALRVAGLPDPPNESTRFRTLQGQHIKVDVIRSGSDLGKLVNVEDLGGYPVVGIQELKRRKEAILKDKGSWEEDEEQTQKAEKDMEFINTIIANLN
jgi:hypothetical protein